MDKLEEVLFKVTEDRLVGQFMHDEFIAIYPELINDEVQAKLADFINDVPAQKLEIEEQQKQVQKQQFARVAFMAKMAGCARKFKAKEKNNNPTEESFEEKAKQTIKAMMNVSSDEELNVIMSSMSPEELQMLVSSAEQIDADKKTNEQILLSDSAYYTDLDSIINDTYPILAEFAERKNNEETKLNLNWQPILVSKNEETKESLTIDSIAMQGAQIFINNDGYETIMPMIKAMENMNLPDMEKQADEIVRQMTNTGTLENLDNCLHGINIHRKLAGDIECEYGKIAATKDVAESAKAAELIDKYPVMAAFVIARQNGQKIESAEQFEQMMDAPEVLRLTRTINNSAMKINLNNSVFKQLEDFVKSDYRQLNGYSMEM